MTEDEASGEGAGKADAAAIHLAPPVVPYAVVLLGVALQALWPIGRNLALPAPQRYWLGGAVVVGAIALLGIWPVTLLRRGGQDENARKPTPRLEARGPYRWTRNPIYLHFLLVCIGLGIFLGNGWVLAITPLGAWALQRLVILPEEAYLERRFGDEYRRYKRRVRRWL